MAEWRSWYEPFLRSLVGGSVATASAWTLEGAPPAGGPGPGHSHISRLELTGSLAVAIAELDARLRDARSRGDIHPAHADVRRDSWAPHRPRVQVGPGDADALITAEVLCTDPRRESEWDAWYDADHLPDMLASGAFVAGSRWRRHGLRPGGANDLTVYEICGLTVTEAVARSASIMPGLIDAGRKHECHAGGPTMALTRGLAE